MKVKLLRRLGQNPADSVIDYDTNTANWLIDKGHAEKVSHTTSEKSSESDPDDRPVSRTPGRPRKAGAK